MRRTSVSIARSVALIAGVLVAGWLLWPASLGGSTNYVVTHGISMQPRFHSGDLAILRPSASYRVGEVVAYHSSTLHTVVMHRIVAVHGDRFTFKGDNNSWLDPDTPTQSALIGALVLRVPQGGVWLHRITAPPVIGCFAFLLLAGGGTVTQQRRKRRRRRSVSRHAKAPSKNALSDLSPTLRTAVSSTAAVGLLALVLTAYAWTTSATAGAMATSSPHRSMAFSYSAPVGKTAVYDSTTVTAPDPIFRRVTNDVTVQYRYHGAPGTISLVAELSAGSGWRYSVPLTTPASFSSTTYSGQTRLHLNALEARAQAAERATGVAAEPLTVTVIPTVRTAGASAFAPKLPLTLSPLELSLADPNHDLTVTDTSTSTRRVLVNRTLTVAGHRLTIGVVRKLATGLLLLSLICAAALVGLARRSAMGGETASIRRRYAGLIVTVAPMPTPAGVAVVDVNDFPTLARIAERYGLFVMYWRRSGVDTFVVQDDATTFRYRVGSGHARANVMAAWEPTESPLV